MEGYQMNFKKKLVSLAAAMAVAVTGMGGFVSSFDTNLNVNVSAADDGNDEEDEISEDDGDEE